MHTHTTRRAIRLSRCRTRRALHQAAAAAGAELLEPRVLLTTYVVTTLADPGAGGALSLRQAITAANTAGGSNTITFAGGLTGTIILGATLPTIVTPLTIDGPGADLITVNASGHGVVFTASASGTNSGMAVLIEGLTISGGSVTTSTVGFGNFKPGAGISNQGASLTIDGCVVTNNSASGYGGGIGGIGGKLMINNSTISGNSASGGSAGGGGICTVSSVLINNSVISGNTSTGTGGGIYAYSNTTIQNSTIISNTASSGGGLAGCGGVGTSLTITGSIFEGNAATAANGVGGGLDVTNLDGHVALTKLTVSGNTAVKSGGGIFLTGFNTPRTLVDSTISGNAAGTGGGVYTTSSSLNIADCTIANNAAITIGGGLMNSKSTLTLTDSTVSGNTAGTKGGGIYSYLNSTYAGTLDGTIIAQNSHSDLFAKAGFFSGRNDLIGDGSDQGSLLSSQEGSTQNPLNPQLSPLGNFGGPTQTMALLPGSVALDNGAAFTVLDSSNNNVTATDQRGIARTYGTAPDIGAFESQTGVVGSSSQLIFLTQPASASAGVTISPPIVVEILDTNGNLATSDNSQITLTVSSGPSGAVAGGTSAVQAINGIATFSAFSILTLASGNAVLQASDGQLGTATTTPFPVTLPPHLAFNVSLPGGVAGSAVPTITVSLLDSANHVLTANTDTVTLSINSGPITGSISGTVTVPLSHGSASFSGLSFPVAGIYTLKASAPGIGSGTSSSFTISSSTPAQILFSVPPPDLVAAGANFPVQVEVLDSLGNPVTSISSVTLSVFNGPGGGTISGTTVLNLANGSANFSINLPVAGDYRLLAKDGNLQASSNAFTVAPAAAAKVVFGQPPTSARAGATLSPAVTVKVEDAFGNLIITDTSSSVTLSLPTAPNNATFAGTLTEPVQDGVATFSDLALLRAGNYTLMASDPGLSSVTSGTISISPAAPVALQFVQAPATATAGVAFVPTVELLDPFGNVATGDHTSVAVSITSGPQGATLGGTTTVSPINGVATFSTLKLGVAGTYTLSAAAGTISGATTLPMTVNPGPVSHLIFAGQPASVMLNDTIGTPITINLADAFGNAATSSTAVTLKVFSGPPGGAIAGTLNVVPIDSVVTFADVHFTVAGGYILQVVQGGVTANAQASLVVTLPPTHLVITQQPTTTVAGGILPGPLVVAVEDSAGQVVASDTSTVTVTLVNGSLSGSLSVAAIAGVATFNDLIVESAGSLSFTVTDGALTSAVSKPVTVSADVTSAHIVVQQAVAPVVVGKALASIVVESIDQFGNLVTTDHSKIILATTAGSFTGAGTVTLSNGLATFNNIVVKSAGDYVLTATPAPGSTLAVLTAADIAVTIDQDPTNAIAAPAIKAGGYAFGAAVPLTVTLTSSIHTGVPFTGVPTLLINGTLSVQAISLTAAGAAKFSFPVLAAEDYACAIVYGGDANHTAASSSTFTVTINHAVSTTALSTSAGKPVFGQPIALTAVVKSAGAPGTARTGMVEFLDNGNAIETVALNASSSASITFTPTSTGSHNLQAIYLGDGDFAGSHSAVVKSTVAKDKVAVHLTPSQAGSIPHNQTFNLDVQVLPLAPGTTSFAGDVVTIKDNNRIIGQITLNADGSGELPGLAYTNSGTHQVYAIFAGDGEALGAKTAVIRLVST